MKGMSNSQAPKGNEWLPTVNQNVPSAGTTLATATVIPAGQDCSIVTTGTGGVSLPASGISFGEEYCVANHTGSAINVYPGTASGKVGTASAGAAYSLAAGKTGYFVYVGPNQWTANP
jgi:hypothetical protein